MAVVAVRGTCPVEIWLSGLAAQPMRRMLAAIVRLGGGVPEPPTPKWFRWLRPRDGCFELRVGRCRALGWVHASGQVVLYSGFLKSSAAQLVRETTRMRAYRADMGL